MKLQQILEARALADKGHVELTQAPPPGTDAKKRFDKMVNDKWVEGVVYRGHNVFELFYQSGLADFLEKQLKEEHESLYDIHSWDSQESYLGYVPGEDFFVMGFDVWAEVKNDYYDWRQEDDDEYDEEEYYSDDLPNMMMVRMEEHNGEVGPEDWKMLNISSGHVYPHGYKALHRDYPQIVDVRLD